MVHSHLEAIPDLPLPAGIEVRPVQQHHLRTIWEAEVEAFRGAAALTSPDDGEFERWLNQPNFQPDRWQAAWEGDQVVGMVRNFIDEHENATFGRRRGYTENISVRPPWRRRGVARALLTRSLRLHREWGMTEAALGVNSANQTGALDLYEEMGFRVTLRQTLYRKHLG
jgi:ribosomal protein S18 acetylase RimI-like enzyme